MVSILKMDGFEAGSELSKLFFSRLSDLLDLAPSDARARVSLSRHSQGFTAELCFASSQLRIQTRSSGKNATELLEPLLQAVYQKISEWRRNRF